MFSIATQTVQLPASVDTDNHDAPTTINFLPNDGDTSKVKLEIITPDGHTHTVLFNKNGLMLSQHLSNAEGVERHLEPTEVAPGTSYGRNPSGALPVTERTRMRPNEGQPDAPTVNLVDGRDTNADNPYTHKAPVDADTAARDGQTPGFKQPHVEGVDDTELRKTAVSDAELAAKEPQPEQDKPERASELPKWAPADSVVNTANTLGDR